MDIRGPSLEDIVGPPSRRIGGVKSRAPPVDREYIPRKPEVWVAMSPSSQTAWRSPSGSTSKRIALGNSAPSSAPRRNGESKAKPLSRRVAANTPKGNAKLSNPTTTDPSGNTPRSGRISIMEIAFGLTDIGIGGRAWNVTREYNTEETSDPRGVHPTGDALPRLTVKRAPCLSFALSSTSC